MAASKEVLSDLHTLVAEELTTRIKSGLWAASDVAVAVKFLKDNDITADPGENQALQDLRANLAAKAKERKQGKTATSIEDMQKIAEAEINKEIWH